METIRSVETSISYLSINDDGIGHMHFKDGITMDIPEQMEHLKGIIELTENYPTPFVVTASEQVTFSKEARNNAIIIEDQSPVSAMAIVIENLAYRLIAEFYLKVQKPKKPFAVFTKKEKAYEWCKQFVNKE